jgi:hypothetical protein
VNKLNKPENRITYTNKGWGVSDYVAKTTNKSPLFKPQIYEKKIPKSSSNAVPKVLKYNNQKVTKFGNTTNAQKNYEEWESDDEDREWVKFK